MSPKNFKKNTCRCGSGQKYKRCCYGKKPRKASLTIDLGKPEIVNGIRVSKKGEFQLLKDGDMLEPKAAYLENNYDRYKGVKTLNRVPINPIKLDSKEHLALRKYNIIFAIDTNTRTIENDIVSISCIVLCKLLYPAMDIIDIEYAPINCFEFRNIKEKQENVAWVKAINMIVNNPKCTEENKIGLVVDSDLGNIHSYNSGNKPIYSNVYIPKNIELIYASADSGKEYILNQLIALCDKEAKVLLDDIENRKVPENNLNPVINEPYTHFRLWNKN